jgi:hypothetical protein
MDALLGTNFLYLLAFLSLLPNTWGKQLKGWNYLFWLKVQRSQSMVAWSHTHGWDILAVKVCGKGYSWFITQEAEIVDEGTCQRTCSPVTYFLTRSTSYLSPLLSNANIWWVHQASIHFFESPHELNTSGNTSLGNAILHPTRSMLH